MERVERDTKYLAGGWCGVSNHLSCTNFAQTARGGAVAGGGGTQGKEARVSTAGGGRVEHTHAHTQTRCSLCLDGLLQIKSCVRACLVVARVASILLFVG